MIYAVGLDLKVDLCDGALDLGVSGIKVGDKYCHQHVLREEYKGRIEGQSFENSKISGFGTGD